MDDEILDEKMDTIVVSSVNKENFKDIDETGEKPNAGQLFSCAVAPEFREIMQPNPQLPIQIDISDEFLCSSNPNM